MKDQTLIFNKLFKDPTISARAKGILAYIMCFENHRDFNRYDLYDHFSEGRTAIDSGFNELRLKGYILQERLRDENGRFLGWEYTFNFKSIH